MAAKTTRRFVLALLVAVIGSGVFLVLRAVLFGLIDPLVYLVACFLGALVSTFLVASVRQRYFAAWLLPATGIYLFTTLLIAAGPLASRAASGKSALPAEVAGFVFWEWATTSWWLIPCAAGTLQGLTAALTRWWPLVEPTDQHPEG